MIAASTTVARMPTIDFGSVGGFPASAAPVDIENTVRIAVPAQNHAAPSMPANDPTPILTGQAPWPTRAWPDVRIGLSAR